MDEMAAETHHEGNTIRRLDRLEEKVDALAMDLSDLKQSAGERRGHDETRLRALEDWRLEEQTVRRIQTQVLTRIFGTSVVAAVGSLLAVVVSAVAIVNALIESTP